MKPEDVDAFSTSAAAGRARLVIGEVTEGDWLNTRRRDCRRRPAAHRRPRGLVGVYRRP
ncbi:hypothetical protein HBB16_05420 [Pseudonocardia sp. MCCB 268]|nr:hypothetical protein [Pseudonocardia cytotoxica]